MGSIHLVYSTQCRKVLKWAGCICLRLNRYIEYTKDEILLALALKHQIIWQGSNVQRAFSYESVEFSRPPPGTICIDAWISSGWVSRQRYYAHQWCPILNHHPYSHLHSKQTEEDYDKMIWKYANIYIIKIPVLKTMQNPQLFIIKVLLFKSINWLSFKLSFLRTVLFTCFFGCFSV